MKKISHKLSYFPKKKGSNKQNIFLCSNLFKNYRMELKNTSIQLSLKIHFLLKN